MDFTIQDILPEYQQALHQRWSHPNVPFRSYYDGLSYGYFTILMRLGMSAEELQKVYVSIKKQYT